MNASKRTVTPTRDYRRVSLRPARELARGLDAVVEGWAGAFRRRPAVLAALLEDARQVDALSGEYEGLSTRHLQGRLHGLRDAFRRGREVGSDVVCRGLAAVREAASRRIGQRPFEAQIAGALALYRGYLAEMATGEGKTLTAVLPAVLFGWRKRPCHVITVNDYLARRDAEWMAAIYDFCGVRAGHVTSEMDPAARRNGYDADVTYCTSKEIVADFLRDGLRLGRLRDPARFQLARLLRPVSLERAGVVMRGLDTAIVDEADSVLIDEAVTPVIISASYPNQALRDACLKANAIAADLRPGEHYDCRERYREVELRDAGRSLVDGRCGDLPGLWRAPARREELVRQALTAREFFLRDKQYVVQDGKVVIVDEFTGRMMPQRTWREGLHQAVEAREGLPVSDPSETLARLSFQRFFRFFRRLSGMTGTAREAADELWHIYRLPVVAIPTHKPCVRNELPDRIFASQEEKWTAVVDDIAEVHRAGRPVLVGTRSVRASEDLSRRLTAAGMEHQVLNAVRHHEEALIVSCAGQAGRITIATNMAGRGTDIKLVPGVAEAGGLHVLATERHESGRIDRQLFGRCARQGDPGSACAFVSAEDELLVRYLPKLLRDRLAAAVRRGGPSARRLAAWTFAHAQRAAQWQSYRQRKAVLRMDDWLDESLSFAGREHEA